MLIVAASLDILGGQAVQAARLLEGLRAEASLDVSFLPINPRLPGFLRGLQNIKYVRTIVTSLAYIALLLWRIARYDVIHVYSASYFSFVLAPTPAILIAKLYGKKAILNYHSGEAADHLARWRRTAIPVMRLSDCIVVPSAYLVKVFADFGLPAQAIFNTVETNDFRFRERRLPRPVFLANRNLEALYNVALVLRAFCIIQQSFPEAHLTIAGEGTERARLEALTVELNLRNVEFTGRVSPAQMPALYDAADVYLNGSDIDNMPLSILEAFAAGVPVVTTNAGGIPYLVTDNETGFLVERGDAEQMARRAMRLLEESDLAERLAKAAHAECRKYSWGTVRDEWLELYHQLNARTSNVLSGEPNEVANDARMRTRV